MGDDGRDIPLAEMEAMIREGEEERARLVREGHPRGDPADPVCPLGSLEVWLSALRGRRAGLLGRSVNGVASGPRRPH